MTDQTTTQHPFDILNDHSFMSLTTYRKNGQAVPTPVWFARVGNKLVMMTSTDAWKVKRIRNNPRVTLAPCDQRGKILGPSTEGVARILEAPAEQQAANRTLNQKYGWMKQMFDLISRLRGGGSSRSFIEITPAA